jgi:hypothetical protein
VFVVNDRTPDVPFTVIKPRQFLDRIQ